MFEKGRVYNRQADLHKLYGGAQQSGICPLPKYPFILVFTGVSGKRYGYGDRWDDGVFLYVGQGQKGDMKFISGNKAIRDHAQDGKTLHLFESLGKSKGYRYVGEFVCATWEYHRGPDVEHKLRQIIVFHLVPIDQYQLAETSLGPKTTDLAELRKRAFASATPAVSATKRDATRTVYERSKDVRDYVLARADGICESCGNQAPFLRKNGDPYLEPHHTRRISDGGPDHPRWVGAVCPNCHSEIHFGDKGKAKNTVLQHYLGQIEGD